MSPGDSFPRNGATERDRLAELGQLAGDLVHELKNPIAVVLLNTELLLAQNMNGLPAQERAYQRILRIRDSARTLQEIVQSFLGFARPSRPDPDAIDLNRLLTTLLEEQADQLEHEHVRVSFHPDEALALLPGDAQHLRSIFSNLIVNARQAMSERPLSPSSTPRKLLVITRAGKGSVRVVIANNGPPFAERVAAHLFEPFVSSKEDGTGLGLAIVRRLVELHHGTITASSDPVQGVSFTLEFPTPLGAAKARTELPMPSVEARVHGDGATVQDRITSGSVLDCAPTRSKRGKGAHVDSQVPPFPSIPSIPVRTTRQTPRHATRKRRLRADGE